MGRDEIDRKIKKAEFELQRLKLEKFLIDNDRKQDLALRMTLDRIKFIFSIQTRRPKEVLLNQEDYKIINCLCAEFNLQEGQGLRLGAEILINYYKSKLSLSDETTLKTKAKKP